MYDIMPYGQWCALSMYMQTVRNASMRNELPEGADLGAAAEQGYHNYLLAYRERVCFVS